MHLSDQAKPSRLEAKAIMKRNGRQSTKLLGFVDDDEDDEVISLTKSMRKPSRRTSGSCASDDGTAWDELWTGLHFWDVATVGSVLWGTYIGKKFGKPYAGAALGVAIPIVLGRIYLYLSPKPFGLKRG